MILLDTNLLVRITRSNDPHATVARAAIHALMQRRERLIVVPQNFYEFWAVATRAAGVPPVGFNGLGMSPAQAGNWLRFFRRRFTLLPDREELSIQWQSLVETHGTIGFRAHDVRLVAAMQTYGIRRLLTFNSADFQNLPITILDPASP